MYCQWQGCTVCDRDWIWHWKAFNQSTDYKWRSLRHNICTYDCFFWVVLLASFIDSVRSSTSSYCGWIADSFTRVSTKACCQLYSMNINYSSGLWTYTLSMPLICYHFLVRAPLPLILMLQDDILRETMPYLFPARCRFVRWNICGAIFFYCSRNQR